MHLRKKYAEKGRSGMRQSFHTNARKSTRKCKWKESRSGAEEKVDYNTEKSERGGRSRDVQDSFGIE